MNQTITIAQLQPALNTLDAAYTEDGNILAGAESLLECVSDELKQRGERPLAMLIAEALKTIRSVRNSMDAAVMAIGDTCLECD